MDIAFIGSGSLGTSLAINSSHFLHGRVYLWGRSKDIINEIRLQKCNYKYMPGFQINSNIKPTNDINDIIDCSFIFICVSTNALVEILNLLKTLKFSSGPKFILCNKGIDFDTLNFSSELFINIMGEREFGIMSGPNFANEIASRKKCVSTLATKYGFSCDFFSSVFFSKTEDIIGAQILGAAKNVIAIACGIAHGLELGLNFRSMVLYYGLNEIKQIIKMFGASLETIFEPCGFGDIDLTCNNVKSRNMSLGFYISKEKSFIDDVIPSNIEGITSAHSFKKILNLKKINSPIVEFVSDVFNGYVSSKDIVSILPY